MHLATSKIIIIFDDCTVPYTLQSASLAFSCLNLPKNPIGTEGHHPTWQAKDLKANQGEPGLRSSSPGQGAMGQGPSSA